MDRSMRPGERIFLACILIFVAGFLAVGFAEEYRMQIFRYPLGLGVLLLAMGLAVLLRGQAAKAREPDEPSQETGRTATAGGLLAAWGCILAVLPTVYLLGYAVGLPAYVAAFVGLRTRRWGLAAALAGGVFLVTYVGFHRLFLVPLPLWPLGLR